MKGLRGNVYSDVADGEDVIEDHTTVNLMRTQENYINQISSSRRFEVPLNEVELDGGSLTALNGFGCEEQRAFPSQLTPEKTDAICFGGRHTLSIDNFRELNSRVVFAEKTNLTCEYLNSYLKTWQNGGGNPNLGYLELGINLINVDTVLNGIEFIHRHHPNDVVYRFFMGSLPWGFNESYEIKRNDGTIASIIMKNGQNGDFTLCVWPDAHETVYPELLVQ